MTEVDDKELDSETKTNGNFKTYYHVKLDHKQIFPYQQVKFFVHYMAGNVFVKNDAYDKRALIHYNEDKGEYKNINLILPFEFRKLNIPSSVPMVAASIAAAQSQMESNTSPLQLISILLTSIVQKLEISQLIYVLYEVLRYFHVVQQSIGNILMIRWISGIPPSLLIGT
ncbi:15092_t:CDS:2 [Funneliformis geosporum]|uniref:15092_t:CDS:1 n=1 Tax=Funneliformis geosporum TaxID=1117311 RepID=A0A9W4SU92_9GLOM|nr:15092_t:CDS:2 [Funneliformis geosporum]